MPGKTYITIVGNAGDIPELRYTPTGSAVANFSVAVTPRFMQDGSWVDGDTTWYRVNAWRTLAENAAETITKGTRVIVYGALENREWEDSDGNRRYSLEITADALGPDLMFAHARLTKSERSQDVLPEEADPEPVRPASRTAKSLTRANASIKRPTASRR